jgi:hypothetical protein
MPLLMMIILATVGTVNGAGGISIIDQHPTDVITGLWWALGIIMSFVTLVLGGVGVWAINKIVAHDKDIAVIKTGCKGHTHRRVDDPEEK